MPSDARYKPFYYSFPTKYCFGKDALRRIDGLIDEFSIDNVLVLTGKSSSERLGIDQYLTEALERKGVAYSLRKGFGGNPKMSQVRSLVEDIAGNDVKFIIAVGGGTVIDLAKAAVYYCGEPGVRIGTILTIPASGSEANRSFVVIDDEKGRKVSVADNRIVPAFAICDPAYVGSLEEIHLRSCLADIMGHLLEQYFCKEPSNYIDALILSSVQYLDKVARRLLQEGDDLALWAEDIVLLSSVGLSYLLSSGRTMDWFVHEVEHGLSQLSKYTHGLGIATLMPRWVRYSSGNAYYRNKLGEFAAFMGLDTETDAMDYIDAFYELVGEPRSLTDLLGGRFDYEELAEIVLDGREGFGRVNALDKEGVVEFLKLADDCR